MVMLEKSNDILKYNQDKVNSRAQLIIYVYTESLLEKKAWIMRTIIIQKNLIQQNK